MAGLSSTESNMIRDVVRDRPFNDPTLPKVVIKLDNHPNLTPIELGRPLRDR